MKSKRTYYSLTNWKSWCTCKDFFVITFCFNFQVTRICNSEQVGSYNFINSRISPSLLDRYFKFHSNASYETCRSIEFWFDIFVKNMKMIRPEVCTKRFGTMPSKQNTINHSLLAASQESEEIRLVICKNDDGISIRK